MLMPKRMKHRKHHRGRMRGKAVRGNFIAFGEYGIIALEPSWISSRQIEAARIAMTRTIKRGGKVWIRVFPDKPITKKPLEQRMGKGKAGVEGYVAVVKPGRVMFEMAGPPLDLARHAMDMAIRKLPIRCKFVTKADLDAEVGRVGKAHEYASAAAAAAREGRHIDVPDDIKEEVETMASAIHFAAEHDEAAEEKPEAPAEESQE